ncbi:MAG: KamA family radical SAM protein [Deltaproteobacteria bacterium]|nr:KamA family radical SAM protein [Deltaproteobacteria bacterium]
MEDWQQQLRNSITDLQALQRRFGTDIAPLEEVARRFPFQITPHFWKLLEEPGDPLWRQFIPHPAELAPDTLPEDPLNEEALSPAPCVVHRYPDRALLLATGRCASYCRFCTRKRRTGHRAASEEELAAGIAYIASKPAIRDVILSGGDPLTLTDEVLCELLSRLRHIRHVEIIRIGSRMPATLPERITERLCRMLSRFHPLFFCTHFNHPRELTEESKEACRRLCEAGIPLHNQSVLLRHVNDTPEIIAELCRKLLTFRVRPYYLHQMDLTRGTGHFRTTLDCGLHIMASLRGRISGLAIPCYVVDLPGGLGKVPLTPPHLLRKDGQTLLYSPDGKAVLYKEEDIG